MTSFFCLANEILFYTDCVSYLMSKGTQVILGVLDVKGLATLASVSDSEIPA